MGLENTYEYVRIRTNTYDTYMTQKIRLSCTLSCRRKEVRIRTYSYVFVRICVRIVYVLCTYRTYPYVSYVIFTPTGKCAQNTYAIRTIRTIRTQYVRKYVRKYVRYVHNRISFCTFVFVRIAYVFVRIRTYCTYYLCSHPARQRPAPSAVPRTRGPLHSWCWSHT
jgi:hypothetical protein